MPSRSSLTTVTAAFVLVALSFIAATIITDRASAQLDEDAVSLAGNAGPSLRRVVALRTELRRFDLAVEDYVADTAAGRPADRQAILRSRARMEDQVSRYLALPDFEGEAELQRRMQRQLRAIDHDVDQILAAIDGRDFNAARTLARDQLRSDGERASDTLLAIINLNARRAEELTARIHATRSRARDVAVALNGISIALAVVIALLALRTMRINQRLDASHAALLQHRADELEQFAARVAHDVLSPLTAVSLAVDLSLRQTQDPEVRAILGRGQSGMDRVRRTVEALYEFARAGARPEPGARAEVAPVVAEVVGEIRPAATEAGATLEIGALAGGAVGCGPGILGVLIANLIRNAVKHGGAGSIVVRAVDDGGEVRFEVEDRGPGVPEAARETIFEPYLRGPGSRGPGLGLGLATVKRVSLAHAGRVGMRPAPEGGSIFWFTLPRAPSPAAHQPRPQSAANRS